MKTVKKLKIKDKNGDIYEFAGGGGASSADSVSYTNGAKPEWDSVEKALNGIIDKIDYVEPKITNFTMSPAASEYEIGQSVTNLSFSWAYNKEITTQSLSDCSLSGAAERSATWSGDLRSNKTFTLSAGDGQKTATASKTISFKHKFYYGVAQLGNFDSAFILGLANKKFATNYRGTYSLNVGENEYAFFACPTSWNMPSSAKIGGFGTDLVECGTISFTNASGHTENFKLIRTNQANLGRVSVVFE